MLRGALTAVLCAPVTELPRLPLNPLSTAPPPTTLPPATGFAPTTPGTLLANQDLPQVGGTAAPWVAHVEFCPSCAFAQQFS